MTWLRGFEAYWQGATGNGETGNNGPHQLDECRWVMGQSGLPPRVISLGGRFGYDDDGETPNTQQSIFDYRPAPIIFEVRGPWLEIDSEKEQFVSGFNFERANELLRREFREPFVVREKV